MKLDNERQHIENRDYPDMVRLNYEREIHQLFLQTEKYIKKFPVLNFLIAFLLIGLFEIIIYFHEQKNDPLKNSTFLREFFIPLAGAFCAGSVSWFKSKTQTNKKLKALKKQYSIKQ